MLKKFWPVILIGLGIIFLLNNLLVYFITELETIR